MNYIKQINGFWNWAMFNVISQGEIALYLAILHCANVSNWKSELNLPNSTLQSLSKISSASQLNKVRNKLVQSGLIKYEKGKKGSAGTYIVVQMYTNTDNNTDAIRTQYGRNSDNNKDAIRTTYINKTETKQNNIIPPVVPQKSENVPYEQIREMFNSICVSYPRVQTLSDSRRKAIRARFKQYSLDDFRALFEKAEKSSFLKGANKRDWSANFDWLIKDSNMAKVLSDNYLDNYLDKNTDHNFDVYSDNNTDFDEIEKLIQEKMG